MEEETHYTEMAAEFNNNLGIPGYYTRSMPDVMAQYEVVEEEYEEFQDAFNYGSRSELAEEMADVLVTLHVLAHRMGIDLDEAYRLKMEYNLQKTAERDENGKVTDDADVEKPDFVLAANAGRK